MKIFASAMGQYDNLGDTVLRRPFLRALREAGELNVFIGTRTEDYLSGLGLRGDERLYRTSKEWRPEVSSGLLKGRGMYAFNAGEIEVDRRYAMHYVRLAPILAASRLRGGRAIHVGLGVRTPTHWRHAVSATLRLCDEVGWRDPKSMSDMGIGSVQPDWAFAEGATDEELSSLAHRGSSRTLVALAPRYNGRPLPDGWVSKFKKITEALDLEVVTVAQIKRDGPLVEKLADQLGGTPVVWLDDNHARQEARVREIYRRSRYVFSDRLHALVIGATEGAIPVGLADTRTDKVVRTLEAAGISQAYVGRELGDVEGSLERILNVVPGPEKLSESIIHARGELRMLTERIASYAR